MFNQLVKLENLLWQWQESRLELDGAAHELARGVVAGIDPEYLVDQYRAAVVNEREAYGVLSAARLAVFSGNGGEVVS